MVNRKRVWTGALEILEAPIQESIERTGTLLSVSASREGSDILLLLDERGPDYAQTLYREKLGRRDATVLVARDAKSGKVLASQRVTLGSPDSVAIDRFIEKLANLP